MVLGSLTLVSWDLADATLYFLQIFTKGLSNMVQCYFELVEMGVLYRILDFRPIYRFISEKIQDRAIAIIKDEWEVGAIYRMVTLRMTLSDLWSYWKHYNIFRVDISKNTYSVWPIGIGTKLAITIGELRFRLSYSTGRTLQAHACNHLSSYVIDDWRHLSGHCVPCR